MTIRRVLVVATTLAAIVTLSHSAASAQTLFFAVAGTK
jgi:hypothetical protein